ncbi:MAG: RNA-binding S4 domain-containing protein [Candidatus Electrothrix sp. AX5]|uniref:Ribosome-associated protein n=1 Tax=Candidatus Electrothrix aarhusensis TaxID=1859131 RepID=A0A444IWQ0_9BACT|nr:RNA-binding S4 domain-containing protein [Candidatus Electrothrix sp. AX5]RWX45294.1 ribosome-associated protein [Candidatus Electrothrix aarhusensis]
MSDQNITISIRDEYIELYKLLKLANVAASGGEAKHMISEGMVRVNGEPETRKRRKTRVGETVQCNGVEIRVIAE